VICPRCNGEGWLSHAPIWDEDATRCPDCDGWGEVCPVCLIPVYIAFICPGCKANTLIGVREDEEVDEVEEEQEVE
jgi:DnaJ-class molecular chaperone